MTELRKCPACSSNCVHISDTAYPHEGKTHVLIECSNCRTQLLVETNDVDLAIEKWNSFPSLKLIYVAEGGVKRSWGSTAAFPGLVATLADVELEVKV